MTTTEKFIMDEKIKQMSVAEAKKKYGKKLVSIEMTTKKAYDLSFDEIVKGASLLGGENMVVVAVAMGKYASTAYMVKKDEL